MTIKLLIIGASQFESITLPEGATVEQLALMKNLTGEFKKIGGGVLSANDVLEDNVTLSFSAGTSRTVTNIDGTTATVITSKKISGANDEGLINVKFVKTIVERELPLPQGISVKEALDLAGIRRGNISINGTPIGFGVVLNSDTTIELSVPVTSTEDNSDDEDEYYEED